MQFLARILLSLMLTMAGLTTVLAEKRVALVVGNSAYEHVVALPNPIADATEIAASLKKLDFDVTLLLDQSSLKMRRALRDFARKSTQSDMAVIYFAGHGIEIGGRNFLIPTDAELKQDVDVEFETVSLDDVMRSVLGAKGLRMVLLDACRNNPFAQSMLKSSNTRSIGRGLARIEPEVGTLVSYAAKEGTVALDGDGKHSPYTKALLNYLGQPGLEVQFLFRKVRDAVLEATNGTQEPFTYGALPGTEIFLVPPDASATDTPSASHQNLATKQMVAAFADALAADTQKDYAAFLNKYGHLQDDPYVIQAHDALRRLQQALARSNPVLQRGHKDNVEAVDISPDGQLLVSGSADNTLRLWDVSTGRLLRSLKGHEQDVNSVAFSPDGKQIVSASGDKTLKLWDVSTGRLLQTLSGHGSSVLSAAFSPDGQRIVSGSSDDTIKLWDAITGRLLQTIKAHGDVVSSVTFSPDGRQLVSGNFDKTLKLWDATTGRLIATLTGHSHRVEVVEYSPDGKQIVSGSRDNLLKIWDASTGHLLRTLKGHDGDVNSAAFSPDGKIIASGSGFDSWITPDGRAFVRSSKGSLNLWDVSSGRLLRTLKGHDDDITSVAFSPDGEKLASGSWDRSLKLWDVKTGRLLRNLVGRNDDISSIAYSSDGRRVASGGQDKVLKLWDVDTGRLLRTLKGHEDDVTSVAFSPDGELIVSASDDKTLRLWDVGTGRVLRTLKGHDGDVNSTAFSPDGKQIVSASDDKTIKLWDVGTGRLLRTLKGHEEYVTSVAFSPDGEKLASGGWDKTLKLWDLDTGRLLRSLKGHPKWINSVGFSPNGKQVLSGAWDDTLKVWDVSTGQLLRTLSGHNSKVNSTVFSPDGGRIVSASDDKTLKLWDVDTGRLLRTLKGHEDDVTSVVFSPDGERIVSGSQDGTIKLWDVDTGNKLASFLSIFEAGALVSLPNGRWLAAKQIVPKAMQLVDGLRVLQVPADLHPSYAGSIGSIRLIPDQKLRPMLEPNLSGLWGAVLETHKDWSIYRNGDKCIMVTTATDASPITGWRRTKPYFFIRVSRGSSSALISMDATIQADGTDLYRSGSASALVSSRDGRRKIAAMFYKSRLRPLTDKSCSSSEVCIDAASIRQFRHGQSLIVNGVTPTKGHQIKAVFSLSGYTSSARRINEICGAKANWLWDETTGKIDRG